MKRVGVLGGISPQATMDFEARVHRVSQALIAQDFNRGYPPMVVWYHRRPPVRMGDDGRAPAPCSRTSSSMTKGRLCGSRGSLIAAGRTEYFFIEFRALDSHSPYEKRPEGSFGKALGG